MRRVFIDIRAIANGWLLKIENHLAHSATESEMYFKTFEEVWDYISKAHPKE